MGGICKIAIFENYSLFCSGISPVLEKISNFKILGVSKNIVDFLALLKKNTPDVIIVDVVHCGSTCMDQLIRIRKKFGKIPVLLVVSIEYSDSFEDYIAMGVNGFVFNSSDPEELVQAVKTISEGNDHFPPKIWVLLKNYLRSKQLDIQTQHDNKIGLTSREIDILKLFCKGMTYKEIGSELHISPRTVESHKKNIYSKIKVKSTAEMIEFAVKHRLNT